MGEASFEEEKPDVIDQVLVYLESDILDKDLEILAKDDHILHLKRGLAVVRAKLETAKEDFLDVKDVFSMLQMACGNENCWRDLSCAKWIKARSVDGRPQYICDCGSKYVSSRER